MSEGRHGHATWKARSEVGETKRSKSVTWNGALDKSAVAALSYSAIMSLTREELIRVVEAADLPMVVPHTRDHLQYLDRVVLERMAHLARRCCRRQGY